MLVALKINKLVNYWWPEKQTITNVMNKAMYKNIEQYSTVGATMAQCHGTEEGHKLGRGSTTHACN